jgi:glycosyltransferase involved in cell wall biosynthesis
VFSIQAMDLHYLIEPKNPNLSHFPNSFENALDSLRERYSNIAYKRVKNLTSLIDLYRKVVSLDLNSQLYVYLFSTQPEYIFFLMILRSYCVILKKNLVVLHQMHEPWYEKGRASYKQRCLVYGTNWMMSRLSDKIIVPSEQALLKAKRFVPVRKLHQINLTFLNHSSVDILKNNVQLLKSSWRSSKVISLIGGTGPDRNPEGFLSLAKIANEKYVGSFSYIRGGRDKKVVINYKEFGITDFSGYITESAKQFLLLHTHFIAVPYAFSTQSAVVAEVLSHGKLLIVNDIPAFRYLKGHEFAHVINFNNPDEILECLDKIQAMDEEDYERCYFLALDYFQKNHSSEYLAEQLIKTVNL